jgi:RNA polymerase sigma factor (sigma-70 family)
MFNETEIVSQAINGSINAFELIVKQYEKLVFSILNKLLGTNEDVEDVSQEVFIKVHRNLKGFQFQSKLSTWIARIAYLTALNHIKKNSKHNGSNYTDDLDSFHFTGDNPESIVASKDISNYISKLIEQMPLQYKTVLTLYHINEFSYQEIEQATGMPEGTVKGYLFRARKLLKEKIELLIQKNQL